MVAYHEYLALSRSRDSAERGKAAHFASSAFIAHEGPTDEQAALFAAVMGFLDDPSVKVRAALAYGLLHSPKAPRPVIIALLQDAPIISRAIAQYSPVLLDTDLLSALLGGDEPMQLAIASRKTLSAALVRALVQTGGRDVWLKLLTRNDIALEAGLLGNLVAHAEKDPELRGVLLERSELPASQRIVLIDQVRTALGAARIVKGAVAPKRLERLLREARGGALLSVGEVEAHAGRDEFIEDLIVHGHLSSRLLLAALLTGRVQFFAAAIGALARMPAGKVATMLERGAPQVLRAAFNRCGLAPELGDVLVKIVLQARLADLADDVSARYFVITVLIDDLIYEHDGEIPESLTEAFAYLNEQCVALGRQAARGVMAGFAREADDTMMLPLRASEGSALAAVA